MQPMNFFRKAKEDITNNILAKLPFGYEKTKLDITNWLTVGARAQKFILPNGGRIINDGLKGLPAEIRLPFPEIILEYEVHSDTPSLSELEFGKENTSQYKKRVLIVKQFDAKHIVMFSLLFKDEARSWVFLPYYKMLKLGKEWRDGSVSYGYMEKHKKEITRDDIYETYALVPGYEKHVPADWPKRAIFDYADETRALFELIEVLTCSNVTTQILRGRKKLNKQAEKRGVLPFDDYRILVIKNKKAGSTEEQPVFEEGEIRNSPREHVRRGHRRTYASGVSIWVQNTVVNAGAQGKINKSYLLEK